MTALWERWQTASLPGGPAAAPVERRVAAWAFALLFGSGGLLALSTLVLSGPPDRNALGIAISALLALLWAAVLVSAYRRLPMVVIQVTPALGALLASVVAHNGGATLVDAYGLFFFWVILGAFYLLSWRWALFSLGVVAASYGVVLHTLRFHNLGLIKWTMMMGTLGVAGLLLAVLQRHARRSTQALRASEQRTRSVIEGSQDAFVGMDQEGRITDWNPQAEKTFGWKRHEAMGRHLADTIVPPSYREQHRAGLDRFVRTGAARILDQRIELSALHRDGHEFPVEVTVSAHRSDDAHYFDAFMHDISERKNAQQELSVLAAIVEQSHDAVIGKTLDGTITTWNTGAERLYGYAASEVRGRNISILVPDVRRDEMPEIFARLARGEAIEQYESVRRARDGRLIDVSLTISPIRDPTGVVIGASSVARDISEHRRLLAELEELSQTDFLTGLANRRAWQQELEREIVRAERKAHAVCVAMIDLDHFKRYNDAHGHPAGDALLKQAASAWRDCLRQSDTICRYGGEEFALLLPDCSPDDSLAILDRIRGCTPNGQTCSAGLAHWDGRESPEELIAHVDLALYDAKRAGRNRIVTAAKAGTSLLR